MTDFTITCNEEVNPFYYILRPNTRDDQRIFKKYIGGSFQTVGSSVYAVEQKQMINLAGIIHTNKLKINYLKIKTNKGNIHGNRHQ